jgi:hypothetical protein
MSFSPNLKGISPETMDSQRRSPPENICFKHDLIDHPLAKNIKACSF